MKNILLFQSKNDIPFLEGRVNIHQPTISEISFIGEENFHIAFKFLTFSKDEIEDKSDLERLDDFDIFMSMIKKTQDGNFYKMKTTMFLSLLFPTFEIVICDDKISLRKEGVETSFINKRNFDSFRNILKDMFKMKTADGSQSEYNPADKRAEKIAEKLKNRKKKDSPSSDNSDISIFAYYISVLSVGLQKDKNVLFGYTVPQLIDEFNRYQKKVSYDAYAAARMAGASDLDEVSHWMDDNK